MGKITEITKQTNNRFLNMYQLDRINKKGREGCYYMASRTQEPEKLKLKTGITTADAVIIYAVMDGKIVLTRQYRYPIDGIIYEFPAGLINEGESISEAGVREMKEETGLDFTPVDADDAYTRPYYTTIGLTDEADAMIYGYASGSVLDQKLDEDEEIEVILADKAEVRRILREERIAIMCAYRLMNYLSDEDPFGFLKKRL